MKPKIIFLLSLLILFFSPFLGTKIFSIFDIVNNSSFESSIFWDMRIPRLILGFFCGGALSLAGLSYQSTFRNPLAGPFTIGVASAASFCIVFFTAIFSTSFKISPSICALVGGGVIIFLQIFIGKGTKFSSITSILIGLGASYIFSSMTIISQLLIGQRDIVKLLHWSIGSLETFGMDGVWSLSLTILILSLFVISSHRSYDLYSTGDEIAFSKGLDVQRFFKRQLVFSTLLVTFTVSEVGPISFVGMIVPHFIKILRRTPFLGTSFCSFFYGGCILVLCDTISRMISFDITIPVGAVTSLLGSVALIGIITFSSAKEID